VKLPLIPQPSFDKLRTSLLPQEKGRKILIFPSLSCGRGARGEGLINFCVSPIRKTLQQKREEILSLAAHHGASNVRIFGSVEFLSIVIK